MARSRRYRRILTPTGASVADLRRNPGNDDAAPTPEPAEEVSYRDLQAQAKDAGIPANQSREDLEAALSESDS